MRAIECEMKNKDPTECEVKSKSTIERGSKAGNSFAASVSKSSENGGVGVLSMFLSVLSQRPFLRLTIS